MSLTAYPPAGPGYAYGPGQGNLPGETAQNMFKLGACRFYLRRIFHKVRVTYTVMSLFLCSSFTSSVTRKKSWMPLKLLDLHYSVLMFYRWVSLWYNTVI